MGKDAVEGNLQQRLRQLERRIAALERSNAAPDVLSELSPDMGLVTAGEFRAGNGVEPGEGFSGVRMTEDGVSGYDNDVLQSSMSATDGKITAGAGDVVLDENGISIIGDSAKDSAIYKVVNSEGYTISGYYSYKDTNYSYALIYVDGQLQNTGGDLIVESYSDTDKPALLKLYAVTGVGWSGIKMTKDTNTDTGAGNKIEINDGSYDIDTIIYSDTGAVLTVDAGDNDVDIATKLNFGDTGAITGGQETIDDDAAFSFTPATARGVLILRSGGANTTIYGMFTFAAIAGTAYCYAWTGAGSAMAATTGALGGTTGTDGKVTVSAHTDGKIYIENRSGGNLNCAWQIVAGA